MYAVEVHRENGTSSLFGPIYRRKTAEKVEHKLHKLNLMFNGHGVSVRTLTPWRKAVK